MDFTVFSERFLDFLATKHFILGLLPENSTSVLEPNPTCPPWNWRPVLDKAGTPTGSGGYRLHAVASHTAPPA